MAEQQGQGAQSQNQQSPVQEPHQPPVEPEDDLDEEIEEDDGKVQTFGREYVEKLRRREAKLRQERKEARSKLEEQSKQLADLTKRLADFEKRDKAEQEKKLMEEGKLQELLDQLKREKETLESQLAAKERDMLRSRIGAELKLPPELWGRIQGDDEETVRQDAQELAKFLAPSSPSPGGDGEQQSSGDRDKKPPIPRNTTPAPGGNPPNTDAQRREKYFGKGAGALGMFTPNPDNLIWEPGQGNTG